MLTLDFLGRCSMAAIFAAILTNNVLLGIRVLPGYIAGQGLSSDEIGVLAQYAAGMLFLLLTLILTVLRRAPRTTSNWPNRLVAVAGTFLSLAIVFLPAIPAPMPVKLAGGGMVLAGTALSVICLIWLGRSFSIDAQARRLVTTGPYALVRHPLYLVEAITLIGLALANSSAPAFALVAITLALQFRRAINEEGVLLAAFPEYKGYAGRVPRLLPFIRPFPRSSPD